MYHYQTGEDIRAGDVVRTGNGHIGVIRLLLRPGTKDASYYNCTGGVLVEEDWKGKRSFLVLPVFRDNVIIDIVFINRGPDDL